MKFQEFTLGFLFWFVFFTLSRELLFSLCLSGRLFPESVLIREPLESALLTLLIFGVDVVYGEAKKNPKEYKISNNTYIEKSHSIV